MECERYMDISCDTSGKYMWIYHRYIHICGYIIYIHISDISYNFNDMSFDTEVYALMSRYCRLHSTFETMCRYMVYKILKLRVISLKHT